MKPLKCISHLFLFLSILFLSNYLFSMPIDVMPGMEDPAADFPGEAFPGDVAGSPDPFEGPGVSEPMPPGEPFPMEPIPGEPMSGEPLSMEPIPGEPMSGESLSMEPIPAAPVVAAPLVTETQLPLVEAGPGKQVSLSETTGPLVQASKVEELQSILDQAESVMQNINGALQIIENTGIELENKFEDVDRQLDSVYQAIGFDRGIEKIELEDSAPEDFVSQVSVGPESFEQQEMQVGLPASPEELEINKQKQELELLKVDVDNIEQQEETLMAKLRELEGQVNSAQTQAASARKTKQQILGAQTVEQANGLLNQLNMIFNQIQAIQTKLQGQFSQEFNNIVTQIQNEIQSVQAKTNEITNKGVVVVQQAPEVAIVVKKKVELKSGIAKKIADFFAFIISLFSALVNWFKELLTLSKQVPPVSVEMQSIPQMPELPSQLGVPPMPVGQQMAPLSPDILSKKFNEQMESYNNAIQKLKEKKIKIKKEEMEIEKKKKLLAELKQQKSALRKYQGLMKQLGFTVDVARAKKSGIRKNVEFAFGKVLDFGGYFLEKVGSVSMGIYEKILLPRLQSFTQAVKQRVEEDQA